MACKIMDKNKINTETENTETATDKSVNSTDLLDIQREDVSPDDLVIRTIMFYKGEKWQNDIIKGANTLVTEPMGVSRDRKEFWDFLLDTESRIAATAKVTLANILSEQRRSERGLKPFPK